MIRIALLSLLLSGCAVHTTSDASWTWLKANKSTDMSHNQHIGVDLGSETTEAAPKAKEIEE